MEFLPMAVVSAGTIAVWVGIWYQDRKNQKAKAQRAEEERKAKMLETPEGLWALDQVDAILEGREPKPLEYFVQKVEENSRRLGYGYSYAPVRPFTAIEQGHLS